MSTVGSSEYGSVMQIVITWPLEERLALANELIQSCRQSDPTGPTRGVSVEELEAMMDSAESDSVGYSRDEDTRNLEEALLDKYIR